MKKKGLIIIPALIVSLFFSGCSFSGKEVVFTFGQTDSSVFSIGEEKCPKQEANVYLCNYKNLYGSINDTDLWSGQFDSERLNDRIKDSCLNCLSEIYILKLYAEENEIAIEKNEEEKIKAAAEEYYSSLTEDEKKYTEASEEDIAEMYRNYVLAKKVYKNLMDNVDEEVSEDEARIIDAGVLFVTDRAKAEEALSKLQAGSSFDSVLSQYSEGEKTAISFGRNTYPKEVEDVVFRLEDGSTSGIIEATDGYYIVKCISKYNPELSEKNKETILSERKEDCISNIISDAEGKYETRIDSGFWDDVCLYDSGYDLTSDSFFEVIDRVL